jgi:hypothetical protein
MHLLLRVDASPPSEITSEENQVIGGKRQAVGEGDESKKSKGGRGPITTAPNSPFP